MSKESMTVKVLVTAIGQQIIAGVKQIENKDTNEIVGYWLTQPRQVSYTKDEEGNIGVNFVSYCMVSDEAEFSIRADHIVAILEPRADVAEGYTQLVFPTEEQLNDGADTDIPEARTDADSGADGAAGDGTEGALEEAAQPVGEDEAVPATVA